MNKDDFTHFKFLNKIYVRFKENRLHSYDLKIRELQQQLEIQKKQFEIKSQYLDNLIKENASIKDSYNDILKLFEKENKIIFIKNNNYDISLWENVFIKMNLSRYVIQTKNEQIIYVFEESMNDFIKYLLTLNYSIIVLSIDKNRISLQIRIK